MAKKGESNAIKRYVAEIDRFANLFRESQERQEELNKDLAIKKQEYDEVKALLREEKEVEHSTVSLLLKFITPGSVEVLPLLDTMEPTNERKQGVGAKVWRKEPIAVLRLSASAMRALISADIVAVGQLQDLLLADPDEWWKELEDVTAGMAEAIAAKFHTFVSDKAEEQ